MSVKIPRITHQIWVEGTAIPAQYAAWRDRLVQMNPTWEHRLRIVPRVQGQSPRLTSNLMRLTVLRNEGGLYLDFDVEPLRTLPDEWQFEDTLLHCDWFNGGPHHAIMATTPMAPAITCLATFFPLKALGPGSPAPALYADLRNLWTNEPTEIVPLAGTISAPSERTSETILYHHFHAAAAGRPRP